MKKNIQKNFKLLKKRLKMKKIKRDFFDSEAIDNYKITPHTYKISLILD